MSGPWNWLVKHRDGFRCVECGSTEDLLAHHIVPRALGGKDILSNGKTLCRKCHSKTHTGKLSADAIFEAKNGYKNFRWKSTRKWYELEQHMKREVAARRQEHHDES